MRALNGQWFHIFKENKLKLKYKREKKILGLFRIYPLNTTANSAQFWWKFARLAVLISRHPQSFSNFQHIFFYLKIIPQNTSARTFSRFIFDGIGTSYFQDVWIESFWRTYSKGRWLMNLVKKVLNVRQIGCALTLGCIL